MGKCSKFIICWFMIEKEIKDRLLWDCSNVSIQCKKNMARFPRALVAVIFLENTNTILDFPTQMQTSFSPNRGCFWIVLHRVYVCKRPRKRSPQNCSNGQRETTSLAFLSILNQWRTKQITRLIQIYTTALLIVQTTLDGFHLPPGCSPKSNPRWLSTQDLVWLTRSSRTRHLSHLPLKLRTLGRNLTVFCVTRAFNCDLHQLRRQNQGRRDFDKGSGV